MQNTQRPVSPSNSDAFLVVRISKRAAFFLSVGFIAFATAIVLRPGQATHPKVEPAVTQAPEPQPEPAPAPTPTPVRSPEPNPHAVRAPIADPASSTNPPPLDPPTAAPPEALPSAQPLPVVTVTRRMVTYDSDPSGGSAAQSDSTLPDNTPTEPPPNPTPPANSPPPDRSSPPLSVSSAIVNGAGSTSPYPLYAKWFEDFHKLHPDVQFNYQPVGSRAGLRALLDGTVDFAAVDAPLTDEQLAFAKVPVLHVPSVIGAVVPVYRLPGVSELRFTPRILVGIFTGRITYWNDSQIAAYNPSANLPAIPIVVIHRADGCSATQIFTNYLSKVSSEWLHQVGGDTSVNWPVGSGAKGNEGVHGLLKQQYGAISYMDFQYAVENHVETASVQNRSGRFVRADLPSLTAAAASSNIPDDFRVWITNAPGADAYPIASLMWFVSPAPRHMDANTRDVAAFLRWMTDKSPQAAASKQGLAPLPKDLADRVNLAISRIH